MTQQIKAAYEAASIWEGERKFTPNPEKIARHFQTTIETVLKAIAK